MSASFLADGFSPLSIMSLAVCRSCSFLTGSLLVEAVDKRGEVEEPDAEKERQIEELLESIQEQLDFLEQVSSGDEAED